MQPELMVWKRSTSIELTDSQKKDDKLFPQISQIKTDLLEIISIKVCDVVRGEANRGARNCLHGALNKYL